MSGLRVSYIRVSSIDQNPERQLEGMTLDKVFTDKVSAKDVNCPRINAVLESYVEAQQSKQH